MKNKIPGYRKDFIKVLVGFFLIFPWITYTKIREYSSAEQAVFSNQQGLTLDFFIYYKEIILLVMAAVLIFWFFAERVLVVKKDNNVPLLQGNNKWLLIASGIFVGCAVLSTIFSEYKKNALWGSPTEGEGLWTLMVYVILILSFYNYLANDYGIALMKTAITILSVVTIFLSLVEWFYMPLLEIGFVKDLVSPAAYAEIMSSVEATVFSSAISLTMYNPGYYGGFVCLLLPFIMMFCLNVEKLLHQILYGLVSVGLMFCVIAANTTTSLYIAILEVVLVVVLFLWKAKDKKSVAIKTSCLVGCVLAAVVLFSVLSGNDLMGILTNANSASGKVANERFVIDDITLDENTVLLDGEEIDLNITHVGGILSFTDEKGNALNYSHSDGTYTIHDAGYENVTVTMAYNSSQDDAIAAAILVDAGYDDVVAFYVLQDGTLTAVGINGAILTNIEGNAVPDFLKEYYGVFTGRGYAWINSMPILKNTVLLGKGPGNFTYYFNHNDYVGLLQTHGTTQTIIDKPHNMYLQYAINLGIPGMLAFFTIIVLTLVKAIKVWKENNQPDMAVTTLHVGGIVAVLGFLIYSIINDSIITVTPTVCMIVGLLLASTYMQKNK